jgi:hypothetical protein
VVRLDIAGGILRLCLELGAVQSFYGQTIRQKVRG